jgi:PhzF family phenazine biosynthesis protein
LLKIPIYQVDAFASAMFKGNPAAVCVLDSWLDDDMLQSIAEENNLAETAFVVHSDGSRFELRWFTPSFEIPLCGHATMAAAHVIFNNLDYKLEVLEFDTKSGQLRVEQRGNLIVMDFPAYEAEPIETTPLMISGLGGIPTQVYQAGINFYATFESEEQVRSLRPDYGHILQLIRGIDKIGIVPTARGAEYDFVSRYFAPEEGTNITEDPVTGSIHCVLIPFWSKRLQKTSMKAFQASARGGELHCEMVFRDGRPRTLIGGIVQPYLEGFIRI